MPQDPGMSIPRQVQHALMYYVKESLLIENRYYTINNDESLTVVADTSNLIWAMGNKNIVYHNPDPSELTNLNVDVSLTHDGTLDYVDHIAGRVYFTVAPTSVTASYSAEIINVINGYPSPDDFEDVKLPIVAVWPTPMSRRPLAIGGGHFVTYNFTLSVYAQDEGKKADLLSRIEEGLQVNLGIQNFNSMGFPLNTDTNIGSVNSSFNRENKIATARILDATASPIEVPTDILKLRHRGEVTVSLELPRATGGTKRF